MPIARSPARTALPPTPTCRLVFTPLVPTTTPIQATIPAINRVIAIKVPNTNGVSSVWQNFITSASQIQVDTGLTFFTALDPAIAAALRAKVDGQTNPPPVIYTFTPGDGIANANVVITGTNFALASAVTFNGVSATFNVDSTTQITTEGPTKGSSRLIC